MFHVKEKLRGVVDFFKRSLSGPLENLLKFFFERWLRTFVKTATSSIDFSEFYTNGLKHIELNEILLNDYLNLHGTPFRVESAVIGNITAKINWKHLLEKSALLSASNCVIRLRVLQFDANATLSDGRLRDLHPTRNSFQTTATTATNESMNASINSESAIEESITESLRQSLHASGVNSKASSPFEQQQQQQQQQQSTTITQQKQSQQQRQTLGFDENIDAYKILVKKLLLGLKLSVDNFTVLLEVANSPETLVFHTNHFRIAQTHSIKDPRAFLTEKIFSNFDFKAHGFTSYLLRHPFTSVEQSLKISSEDCIMCCAHEYETQIQLNTSVPRQLIKASLRNSRLIAALPRMELMATLEQLESVAGILKCIEAFHHAQFLHENHLRINSTLIDPQNNNQTTPTINNPTGTTTLTQHPTTTMQNQGTNRIHMNTTHSNNNNNNSNNNINTMNNQQPGMTANRKRVYSFDYNEVTGNHAAKNRSRKNSINLKPIIEQAQPFNLTIIPSSDTITETSSDEASENSALRECDLPDLISSERDAKYLEDEIESRSRNRELKKQKEKVNLNEKDAERMKLNEKKQQHARNEFYYTSQLSEFLEDAAVESEEEFAEEPFEDERDNQQQQNLEQQLPIDNSPFQKDAEQQQQQYQFKSQYQSQHQLPQAQSKQDLRLHSVHFTSIDILVFTQRKSTSPPLPPRSWLHARNANDNDNMKAALASIRKVNARNTFREGLFIRFDSFNILTYNDEGSSMQFLINKIRASTLVWQNLPHVTCQINHAFILTDSSSPLKRCEYTESTQSDTIQYVISKQLKQFDSQAHENIKSTMASSAQPAAAAASAGVQTKNIPQTSSTPSTARINALNILANSHKRSILVEAASIYVSLFDDHNVNSDNNNNVNDNNNQENKNTSGFQDLNSHTSSFNLISQIQEILLSSARVLNSDWNLTSNISQVSETHNNSNTNNNNNNSSSSVPPNLRQENLLNIPVISSIAQTHKFHLSISRISCNVIFPNKKSNNLPKTKKEDNTNKEFISASAFLSHFRVITTTKSLDNFAILTASQSNHHQHLNRNRHNNYSRNTQHDDNDDTSDDEDYHAQQEQEEENYEKDPTIFHSRTGSIKHEICFANLAIVNYQSLDSPAEQSNLSTTLFACTADKNLACDPFIVIERTFSSQITSSSQSKPFTYTLTTTSAATTTRQISLIIASEQQSWTISSMRASFNQPTQHQNKEQQRFNNPGMHYFPTDRFWFICDPEQAVALAEKLKHSLSKDQINTTEQRDQSNSDEESTVIMLSFPSIHVNLTASSLGLIEAITSNPSMSKLLSPIGKDHSSNGYRLKLYVNTLVCNFEDASFRITLELIGVDSQFNWALQKQHMPSANHININSNSNNNNVCQQSLESMKVNVYDALLVVSDLNKAMPFTKYSASEILILKQGVYTQEQQFSLHRQPIAVDIFRILSNHAREDYKLNQSYYFSQRMIMLPRSHMRSTSAATATTQTTTTDNSNDNNNNNNNNSTTTSKSQQVQQFHPQLLEFSSSDTSTQITLTGCIFRLTDHSFSFIQLISDSLSNSLIKFYLVADSSHLQTANLKSQTTIFKNKDFNLKLEDTCIDISLSRDGLNNNNNPTSNQSDQQQYQIIATKLSSNKKNNDSQSIMKDKTQTTPIDEAAELQLASPRVLISVTSLHCTLSNSSISVLANNVEVSMSCLQQVDSTQSLLLLDFEHSLIVDNIWHSLLKDDLKFVSLLCCPCLEVVLDSLNNNHQQQGSHSINNNNNNNPNNQPSTNSNTTLTLSGIQLTFCADSLRKSQEFIDLFEKKYHESIEVNSSSVSSEDSKQHNTMRVQKNKKKEELIAALRLQMKLRSRMEVGSKQDEEGNVIVSQKKELQASSLLDQQQQQFLNSSVWSSASQRTLCSSPIPESSFKLILHDCSISLMTGTDFPTSSVASQSNSHHYQPIKSNLSRSGAMHAQITSLNRPYAIPSNLLSRSPTKEAVVVEAEVIGGDDSADSEDKYEPKHPKDGLFTFINNYLPQHARVGRQQSQAIINDRIGGMINYSENSSRDAKNRLLIRIDDATMTLIERNLRKSDDPDPLFANVGETLHREVKLQLQNYVIFDEISQSTIHTLLSRLETEQFARKIPPMLYAVISTKESAIPAGVTLPTSNNAVDNSNGNVEQKLDSTKCLRVTGTIDPADIKLNIHGKTLDFIIEFFELKSDLADLMAYSESKDPGSNNKNIQDEMLLKSNSDLPSKNILNASKTTRSVKSKGKKNTLKQFEDEWEVVDESSPMKKQRSKANRTVAGASSSGFEKYSDFESSTDSEKEEEENREILFENEIEQMHHFLQTSTRRNLLAFQAFQNNYSSQKQQQKQQEIKSTPSNIVTNDNQNSNQQQHLNRISQLHENKEYIVADAIPSNNQSEGKYENDNDHDYDDDLIDQISFSSLLDNQENAFDELDEIEGDDDNYDDEYCNPIASRSGEAVNNDRNESSSINSKLPSLNKPQYSIETLSKSISNVAIWVDQFVIRKVRISVDYDRRGVSVSSLLLENFGGLEALNLSSISGVNIALPRVTLNARSIRNFREIGRTVAAEYISDMASNPELSFLSLAQKLTIISSISSFVSSFAKSIQPIESDTDPTLTMQLLSYSALDITSALFSSLHAACDLVGIATPPPTRYLSNVIRSIQTHVVDSANTSNHPLSNNAFTSMHSMNHHSNQKLPQYNKYKSFTNPNNTS